MSKKPPVYREGELYHKGYLAGSLDAQREQLGKMCAEILRDVRGDLAELDAKIEEFRDFQYLLRALDKHFSDKRRKRKRRK